MNSVSAPARLISMGLVGAACAFGVTVLGLTSFHSPDTPPAVVYKADSFDDEIGFLTGNDAMNIYTPDSRQINGQPQNIGGGRNSSGIGKSCNNPGVHCR